MTQVPRRGFLRGLLALPFAPVLAKYMPEAPALLAPTSPPATGALVGMATTSLADLAKHLKRIYSSEVFSYAQHATSPIYASMMEAEREWNIWRAANPLPSIDLSDDVPCVPIRLVEARFDNPRPVMVQQDQFRFNPARAQCDPFWWIPTDDERAMEERSWALSLED